MAERDAGVLGFLARRTGVAAPSSPAPARKARRAGKPVFDCAGNCGRKAAAWQAKNAVCRACAVRLAVEMPTPPPVDDIDLADIPF